MKQLQISKNHWISLISHRVLVIYQQWWVLQSAVLPLKGFPIGMFGPAVMAGNDTFYTAVMAGNDTFFGKKRKTWNRKTFITQPKHMIFC